MGNRSDHTRPCSSYLRTCTRNHRAKRTPSLGKRCDRDVNLQQTVAQFPDLNLDRVPVVRRLTDAQDPIAVATLLDGVLAFGQGVPQLDVDGLVMGSRHDLTIVHGESDQQYILSMIFETTGGLSDGNFPQAQGIVPGIRQDVVPYRRFCGIL